MHHSLWYDNTLILIYLPTYLYEYTEAPRCARTTFHPSGLWQKSRTQKCCITEFVAHADSNSADILPFHLCVNCTLLLATARDATTTIAVTIATAAAVVAVASVAMRISNNIFTPLNRWARPLAFFPLWTDEWNAINFQAHRYLHI